LRCAIIVAVDHCGKAAITAPDCQVFELELSTSEPVAKCKNIMNNVFDGGMEIRFIRCDVFVLMENQKRPLAQVGHPFMDQLRCHRERPFLGLGPRDPRELRNIGCARSPHMVRVDSPGRPALGASAVSPYRSGLYKRLAKNGSAFSKTWLDAYGVFLTTLNPFRRNGARLCGLGKVANPGQFFRDFPTPWPRLLDT
jgi:hypothetical protein